MRANSSGANALSPGEEVTVVGTSLDFDRNSRVMHVLGPASAQSKSTHLTAGELTMDLDAQFRAHQLLASGSVGGELPRVVSQSKAGSAEMSVSGERLTARIDTPIRVRLNSTQSATATATAHPNLIRSS